jgi:hypothetical protein
MKNELWSLRVLTERSRASIPTQILAIAVGWVAATFANVAFYLILKRFFGIQFVAPSQFPPPEVSPLPATDVIIFSAIFSIGAGVVFLIITNVTATPAPIFAGVSLVVLIISFVLPLRIPTPPIPMSTKWSLVGMHVLGAAVLVPILILIGIPRHSRGSTDG